MKIVHFKNILAMHATSWEVQNRIPLESTSSAPAQTSPGTHSASYTTGTGSFAGVMRPVTVPTSLGNTIVRVCSQPHLFGRIPASVRAGLVWYFHGFPFGAFRRTPTVPTQPTTAAYTITLSPQSTLHLVQIS